MAALKDDLADAKVTMADFESALNDVKPAFGVDTEALSETFLRGIIEFSPDIRALLEAGATYSKSVIALVTCLAHQTAY